MLLELEELREKLREGRNALELTRDEARRSVLLVHVLRGENQILKSELGNLRPIVSRAAQLQNEVGVLVQQFEQQTEALTRAENELAELTGSGRMADKVRAKMRQVRDVVASGHVTPITVAKIVLPTRARAGINRLIGRG